jgi:hypothetical protein
MLIPMELDDPGEGFGMREVAPDHPDYATWLACSEEGEAATDWSHTARNQG